MRARPKVGLVLPLFSGDPARVLRVARDAERLGFDGVFAFDHLFPIGGPSDGPALECFTTLAAVAAVTSRVTIGSLVTRAVLRSPAVIAKSAATVDAVAGGRVVLGIGTGDGLSDAEQEMFGIAVEPPSERRERLAETAAAVRALFDGTAYPGGRLVPPIRGPLGTPGPGRGGPPIWVGGTSDAVVRIAASIADGWNGWGIGLDRFGSKVRMLDDLTARSGRRVEATWGGIALVGEDEAFARGEAAAREARGRLPATFTGSIDGFVEHLEALAGLGATWAVVVLAGPADRLELVADRLAEG